MQNSGDSDVVTVSAEELEAPSYVELEQMSDRVYDTMSHTSFEIKRVADALKDGQERLYGVKHAIKDKEECKEQRLLFMLELQKLIEFFEGVTRKHKETCESIQGLVLKTLERGSGDRRSKQ